MAMKAAVTKAKAYAFSGTGAIVGACAGGPVGMAVGIGVGALIDWWRRKKAAAGSALSPVTMLPPMDQPAAPPQVAMASAIANLGFNPALAALQVQPPPNIRLKTIKMAPPKPAPPKPAPKPPPKKPAPPPPPKPKPAPAPAPQSSGSGDVEGGASFDISASGGFSL